MEELREAFDQFGWLLSAAVPAPKSRVDAGYDVKKIAKVLDFINVMTYDLHGSWDGFAGKVKIFRESYQNLANLPLFLFDIN